MPSSLTVYKASAGSGKTFTLTIEYIKTIITQPSPNAFSHILAVTFTNKATAEMKNRILQQLYGIWKALPSSNNYLNALKAQLKADNTPLNNTQIQQRAGAALRSILHNYDHFRIETIDSFFQSILRNLAHELNLTPNLKVELNDKQALSKAVDNLIEHLNEKPEVLKWVLAYAKERIANNQHWDISRELKTFGQCIFKEDYLLHEQALRNALNNNQLIETLKNELNKIIKNTKENVVTATRNLTQQMIRLNISYNTLSHGKYLNSYVEKLKTGQLNTKFPTTLQSWLDNPERCSAQKTAKTPTYSLKSAYSETSCKPSAKPNKTTSSPIPPQPSPPNTSTPCACWEKSTNKSSPSTKNTTASYWQKRPSSSISSSNNPTPRSYSKKQESYSNTS